MKKLVIASYELRSYKGKLRRYSFRFLAHDKDDAERHIAFLNSSITLDSVQTSKMSKKALYETYPAYYKLNQKDFKKQKVHIMHQLCFLSYFAMNSGTYTTADILGDSGVIHLISHFVSNMRLSDDNITFQEMCGKYRKLYNLILNI